MNTLIRLTIAAAILATISLTACTSKTQIQAKLKAEAEAKRPEWAKQTPINNDGYYWGVGEIQTQQSTPITNSQKERTRQIALSDIASAISVNISSQSILATAKVSDQLKQTFQKTIKLSSKITLEGVQLVDTYRDPFAYFELYRLNQEEYQQQQQRAIQAATDQAAIWLEAMATARQRGDYNAALTFGLKTLNGLTQYWDQNVQIVRNGKNVNPIAEADREIHEIIRLTTLKPITSPLEITPGSKIEPKMAGFKSIGANNTTLANLPIRIKSEGIKLTLSNALTNHQGIALIPITPSSDDARQATITASLDLRPIIAGAELNESIQQYAMRLPTPETKLTILQMAPKVRISTTTHDFHSNHLLKILSQEIEHKGIEIVNTNNAETIEITTSSKKTNQKTYITVTLEMVIRYDGKNQSKLTATHSAQTEQEATLLCYETINNEIRGKAAGKIYYWLFGEE